MLMKVYRFLIRTDRWCYWCGEPIKLGTSEIYDPMAVNPYNLPFYFELCENCAIKLHKKRKELQKEIGEFPNIKEAILPETKEIQL